jgi:hypothetical protein
LESGKGKTLMNPASRFARVVSHKLFGLSALVAVLFTASCNSTPQIVIGLASSSGQSLAAGQSTTITASVSGDSTGKGVTWTLSPTTGAGALSGSTTTAVTYTAPATIPSATTVTITATSVANTAKSAAFIINLLPVSISLAPTSPQTLEQGQNTSPSPITATISNDPSNKGVTWSLAGAGAISGQTATTVVYKAPASITAASTATVTATSVADTAKTAAFTINLVPPPSITTSSLPAGTVGVAYTTSLAATNGVAPYTWSVTVGTLPAGLTLAASTGAITGTPTALGTSTFTVQVKDADNFTAIAALSIKINPAPVSITTTSLPNGVVNTSYSATLQSTGGAPPITWSVTAGALPTGLVLNAATGAITGTPTTAGTSNFTVQAADSSTPALTATKALSIAVIPVLSVTTSSLPNGITSTAYSATLQSTGGVTPVAWSVTVGSLPAGLSLNASTGAITGTPTTAGTSNFTVQAADSGTPQQKVTKVLSITVVQQLVVTNNSLPTGAVNSVYSATLQSSGGTPAVTWAITVGTLPAGLTLNAATGAITGTPITAATSNFTVQATDSGTPQQTATKAFMIVINPVLAVTTASPMPSGTAGTAYSQTLQTNGGGIAPITWSITLGSLPTGLSLAPSTGVISGTPTTATGSPFNFTVQAADSGTPQQTSSKALSIAISTAPLSVATTGLPDGVIGQSYSGALLQSAGGNPPVTWSISVGALPAGLTLNASTGAVTGTPTTAGTTTFTVKATDSTTPTAQTATKQLSIRVNTVLTVTTASLPAGTVNNSYTATLTSSGGATPITWSITAGSLPPGLTLVPSTGVISGTPNTTTGSPFNFTVRATDATSPTAQTATANLSITVTVTTLTITTSSLPNGTVNSAYNQQLNFNGGTPPVTWSISTGALPSWASLNTSTGAITGTPNATGATTFTVKATDSATPTPQTATQNLSITVNAAPACVSGGSESLLSGQYAFLLKGFDTGTGTGETSPQPVAVGGVLTFNGTNSNGLITAGTIDINQNSGFTSNAVTSGSYGVGSDHRGCMVITTSAGTQNYRFSLGNISSGVASTGHMIDFDSTGPFTTGVLRKQNSAAFSTVQVTGNYAFGVSSIQNIASCNGGSSCGGKFGAVGVLNLAAGAVTGGEVDFNNNGQLDGSSANLNWPASPISINSGGSYTVSGTNGRGTLSFTPAATGATVVNSVIYVVSSTDVLILNSDNQTSNSLFAGELLQQSGTPFSANPLSGAYIAYQSGLGSTAGTSRTTLLLLNASGSGISGTQLRNDAGSFQSKSLTGITYSVASSGRMTVVGGSNPPIFYLATPNQAFILSGDSTVETGFLQSQTGSPFSNSSASGTYAFGALDPQHANVSDNSGVATFDGVSAITGTSDDNSRGSLSPNGTFNQTYSVDSTGLGHILSGCTITATSTTCQTIFYVISPTRAVVMDVSSTNTNPNIQVADK